MPLIAFDATAYRLVLALGGLAFLLAAWVPAYTTKRPMSVPMVLVVAGAMLFAIPGMPDVDPVEHRLLTEHLTEFGVIIALLGAGLKLDRPVGLSRWELTWRLLGPGMLLTIASTALFGWAVAGLAPAAALLLGAVLAPTDPVLAADVQVGEPSVESDGEAKEAEEAGAQSPPDDEDDVRFSLTSEAGLNDGLAFPFVYAAIALAAEGSMGNWFGSWLLTDLLGRVVIGTVVGWLIGKFLGRVSFNPPGRLPALADAQDGFVALAATFLAYGVTELAHGYGFLAVFVAAVSLRNSARGHSFHRVLHNFAGQIEQLVVIALLILLGGAVVTGALAELTWRGASVGIALILVLRPMSARLALIGAPGSKREHRAISFFGIRGIGSLYYLAFAVDRAEFEHADELWAITIFTIVASVVIHGVTATPVMTHLDRRNERRQAQRARGGSPLPRAGLSGSRRS